ncbi:lysylphosphatidylglycerol synthase transmembrane domain-containing protein [Myxococcota bacterium]
MTPRGLAFKTTLMASDTPSAERTLLGARLRQRRIAVLGSIVIAFGFAWLLQAGALPVVPQAHAFSGVRWWTVAVYTLVWFSILLLRSARWYLLLAPVERVTLRHTLAVGLIGYGAIALLPFRAGEAVRPALIRKHGKLNLWAATGTVAAERVIDGLVLSVALVTALLFARPLSPLPDRIGDLPIPAAAVRVAAWSASSMFGVLFLALVVFYHWRDFARRLTQRAVGTISPRAATRLADVVERLADGLRFLPRWRYTGPFLALTAAYWGLYLGTPWLLMWGSGLESVSVLDSVVVMGVLALGFIVPNVPGFFGAFQISVYSGLVMFFPLAQVTGPGSAFVFLLYLIQVGGTLIAGAMGLALESCCVKAPRPAVSS